MSTTAVRSQDAPAGARVGQVDLKLEVVTIPVADFDRAKEFHGDIEEARDDLVRHGVQVGEVFHSPMASTRSAPGSATRTGPHGMPRTWWRSSPARNSRCKRVAWSPPATPLHGRSSRARNTRS